MSFNIPLVNANKIQLSIFATPEQASLVLHSALSTMTFAALEPAWDFLQPGGGQENSLAVILPPKAPQTQSSWSPHSLVCWPARWPWPTWWAGAPTLSRGAWGNVFQWICRSNWKTMGSVAMPTGWTYDIVEESRNSSTSTSLYSMSRRSKRRPKCFQVLSFSSAPPTSSLIAKLCSTLSQIDKIKDKGGQNMTEKGISGQW